MMPLRAPGVVRELVLTDHTRSPYSFDSQRGTRVRSRLLKHPLPDVGCEVLDEYLGIVYVRRRHCAAPILAR